MLCVLQAAVVENDTNYTLLKKDSNVNDMIQTPSQDDFGFPE